MPRVLGVGEMGARLDELPPAEQVPELDRDEGEEEEVEERKDGAEFDDAEPRPASRDRRRRVPRRDEVAQ